MNIKYVLILQGDIAHQRCSGFACTNAFYNKDTGFEKYDETTRYISFTCGGCCGKGVAAQLEHFSKKLKTKNAITKEEVAVHLSSCIVNDNYHYNRCPHADYIKEILVKKGYNNIIEGSYISKNAKLKRETGEYACYE